ncbi:MAG: hypothetical protein CL675_04565 [Bdellovibrionaceae bacterium]|nr:hypothetical protein [Pseudobdellovibrionaceae bacterium]
MLLRWILTGGLLISASSCAVLVDMPSNRFLTSETPGDTGKLQLDVRAIGVQEAEIIDDVTSSSPDTTPVIRENSVFGVGAELALHHLISVYGYTGVDTPAYIGAKIQLIGAPEERASQGNFSVAIAGAMAFGDDDEATTSGDITADTSVDYSGYEAAVLIGYRMRESALIYFGPYISETNAEARNTRTESGSETLTEVEGEGTNQGVTLGLKFGRSNAIYFQIEAAYSKAQWTRTTAPEVETEENEEVNIGAAIGISI